MNEITQQFNELFVNKTPLVDLRAPIEFEKGAFSQSVNLPLMTNKERELVGTCYKQQGQQAAIALGHQLVSGITKQQRMERWLLYCQQHPNVVFYCFRGGLRSQTVQHWLTEAGIDVPIVKGGYKALRQFLLSINDKIPKHPLYLLAGNTGSGKTGMLSQVHNSIDLERAADHRGSSFGAFVHPQASQINFENSIAEQYLTNANIQKSDNNNLSPIILEDEGHLIGKVHLPLALLQAMKLANVIVVEQPFDFRVGHIFHEYITQMSSTFITQYGVTQGLVQFEDYLKNGLVRIKKRLGNERFIFLSQQMQRAFNAHQKGDFSVHQDWLVPLISDYYDPMYQYQLSLKQQRIVFKGNKEQCIDYMNSLTVTTV